MKPVRTAVVGGSGFTGGELLRLLIDHPCVRVEQVSSRRLSGKPVSSAHPHLRKRTELSFCLPEEIQPCDLLFLALPHGRAMEQIDRWMKLAPKIIDLSADFRLKRQEEYPLWYHRTHPSPRFLSRFVYGIPELHRDKIRTAAWVSGAGCNATAVTLALFPLFKLGLADPEKLVIEVKVGSSEGGIGHSESSHHSLRSHSLRSYRPTGHRHAAEIRQELESGEPIGLYFSATAVDAVRGILATSHVFLRKPVSEKDIWKAYREFYGNEPFVRIVKEREGLYRFPDPKLLWGTNFCDIGFELDPAGNRLVVISALDNLMKGAAGQAVQAMNLMLGIEETAGLTFPGLHPV